VLMVLTIARGAVKARQETAIRLLHAEHIGFSIMTEASDRQLVRELMAQHWGKLYPVLFCLVDGHAQYLADWQAFQKLFHTHKFQAIVENRIEVIRQKLAEQHELEARKVLEEKQRQLFHADEEGNNNSWSKFTKAVSTRASALLGHLDESDRSEDRIHDEADGNAEIEESIDARTTTTTPSDNTQEALQLIPISIEAFAELESGTSTLVKLSNSSYCASMLLVCGSSNDLHVKRREEMAIRFLEEGSYEFVTLRESDDQETFSLLASDHVGMAHPLIYLVYLTYAKFWGDWADFRVSHASGKW
jgi:hypothetical protein